jgi:hypothetical protein
MKATIYLLLMVLLFGAALLIRLNPKPVDFPRRPRDVELSVVEPGNITSKRESVREINYFETQKDVNNWFLRFIEHTVTTVKLSDTEVSQGKHSMKVDWNGSPHTELILVHFPQDWAGYRKFLFDIYNPGSEELTIELKIGAFFDGSGFYPHRKRYESRKQARPGWNYYDIPFEDIAGEIDITSQKKDIFLRTFGKNVVFYVDNMRITR